MRSTVAPSAATPLITCGTIAHAGDVSPPNSEKSRLTTT